LPAEETDELCAEGCAHFVQCLWATDLAACEANCRAQSAMWRGDGFRPWLECMIAADCSEGTIVGEACYVEIAGSIDSRSVHDEFAMRCTEARAACGEVALNGCDLDEVILFSDAYMTAQVLPCFDLDCFGLAACLEENVLDAF
jgi:hypothetical protein